MELLQYIFDLFAGGFYDSGVSYAIAWYAPLIASGVGAGINWLSSRGAANRDKRRAAQTQRRADEALGGVSDAMGRVSGRATGIREDYTPNELYGPIIQNMSDRASADQGTAMLNAFRGMQSAGGDVSGSGAVMLNQLQQTGQRSISDIVNQFTQLTTSQNLRNAARKDSLLTTDVNQRQNFANLLIGANQNAQARVDERGVANKQFLLDALGIGASASGQLFGMENKIPDTEEVD